MIKKMLSEFNVKEYFELWLLAYFLYVSLESAESITGQNINIDSDTILWK